MFSQRTKLQTFHTIVGFPQCFTEGTLKSSVQNPIIEGFPISKKNIYGKPRSVWRTPNIQEFSQTTKHYTCSINAFQSISWLSKGVLLGSPFLMGKPFIIGFCIELRSKNWKKNRLIFSYTTIELLPLWLKQDMLQQRLHKSS